MTRRELAEHIRTISNGFLLPLNDGTRLSKHEKGLLQAYALSAAGLAHRIEHDQKDDHVAIESIHSNESLVYGD